MQVINFTLYLLVPQLGLSFQFALLNCLDVGKYVALVRVEEAEFFVANAATIVVVDHAEHFLEVGDWQQYALLLTTFDKLLDVQLAVQIGVKRPESLSVVRELLLNTRMYPL